MSWAEWKRGARVFFDGSGVRHSRFTGTLVDSLLVDALFAHIRMTNAHMTRGCDVRHETEWEIYTEVLSRLFGVDMLELRARLAEEWAQCRDIQICRERVRFWAYSKIRPW